MSYEAEAKALGLFINANSFFGLSPFSLDGEAYEEAHNSGGLTIIPGVATQRSIGSPITVGVPGVAMITFLMEGDARSILARQKADEIVAAFFDQKIDETGTQASGASTMILDFGATGFVPHVSTRRNEAPFVRTVISASFLRTEKLNRS